MKQFDHTNQARNLPDCYAKDVNSNNYKVLLVEGISVNDGLQIDIKAVDNALDIENATGKTLDLYGEMVNQARGQADDVKYRLMIKSKVASSFVSGDHKSIVDAICLTFNCKPSEVSLKEIEGSPCSVELGEIPLDTIIAAELSPSQAVAMIKRLLPTGVKLDSFLFEGTFEFSEAESEADASTGFADEDGTIGGYLGITSGDEDDAILPID